MYTIVVDRKYLCPDLLSMGRFLTLDQFNVLKCSFYYSQKCFNSYFNIFLHQV